LVQAQTTRDCLVLIPGTLCDQRLFKRCASALRRQCRLIVLDYQRLQDLQDWPRQLLQQLPTRFSLAGFSLGGIWALELLRRAPERIERLALIASNAEAGGRRSVRRNTALRRLWQRGGPDRVLQNVMPDYFHHKTQRQRHAGLVQAMARSTPSRAARTEFEWAAQRPAGLAALAALQAPLLIVSGAQDRICPRSLQQRMCAAQPNAQWVELPRCGHFIPLEQPAALTRLLLQWLRRPSAAGG
jgi:pimeloyl-ACP methyl ester carboxylesterase